MKSRLPSLSWILFGIFALVALPAVASNSSAADTGPVTFYSDVLPLLQESCQSCHRPNGANLGGMVAPMSFTSYGDTRPWAKSIARKVEAREMPPWHASQEQSGLFENERTLSDQEIDVFVRWAKGGAVAGDPASAPPPVEFPSADGWLIGEPELIVAMPEKYFVEDNVEDQYTSFRTQITEEMLPEPRWVRAVEFRPGSSAVHHIIAPPLGGIAPGNDPTTYKDGYGSRLEPGVTVRWQMHYHKEAGPGSGVWDQSQVGIRFYPKGYEPQHIMQSAPMGNLWFEIPPGDSNYTSKVSYTFERDSKIVSFLPHAHLRGKAAKFVAYYPDGAQETLLDVPKYDFNWQTTYRYRSEKVMPAGSRVELTMVWDNSAENPNNPDPTETVVFGQPTTAEMMFGFMAFTDAEEGYSPPSRGGFGSRPEGEAQFDARAVLRQQLGVDLESLSPEDRGRLLKSFMNRGRGGQREGESDREGGTGNG